MIDVKYPLRKAYTTLLKNHLVFNAAVVPVSDSVEDLGRDQDTYVVFSQQDGTDRSTATTFHSEETMQLNIVTRGTRVSKATVDNIASQIMSLVLPTAYPRRSGLQDGNGINMICPRLEGDRYLVFKDSGGKNVITRVLTFSHFVSQ